MATVEMPLASMLDGFPTEDILIITTPFKKETRNPAKKISAFWTLCTRILEQLALMSKISPLAYSALIGLFPYGKDGHYSSRLKSRVIMFNLVYFGVSITCRVFRIVVFKHLWLNDVFTFCRIFVYFSIQVMQMIFMGCHLHSAFSNRRIFEKLIAAASVVPCFLKVLLTTEVIYTASLIVMFVIRCIQLNTYFGIWNTTVIVVLNHISFQVTLLFTFFAYNIVRDHEDLTHRMTFIQDFLVVSTFLDDHYKSMKLFEELNAVFKPSLVFMYGDIFISLAYYSYYMTTLSAEGEDAFFSYLLNMLLLTGRFTMLFSTSFTTERVMASADRFNKELFRLMNDNQELRKDNILHLYMLYPKTIKFSACGFFTLGNEVVTEMAAAVVTYLVALVQLSGG